jgi:hypothetical protein
LPAASPTDRISDLQIRIPADGGYTITLLTSTQAALSIDNLPPAQSPKPRAQVCGSPGNAVQPVRVSAALSAGTHHIQVVRDDELDNAASDAGDPVLYWEGPGIARQLIPQTAYVSPTQ